MIEIEKLCEKLPPLIKMESFDSDWKKFLDYLYKLYLNDFYNNKVYFKGSHIKTFTDLNYELKQVGFDHITTKGSSLRIYNQSRCERYNWIKAILESETCHFCDEFAMYPEKDRNRLRYIIWCKTVDFVIVLEKRGDQYFLISSYCVLYDNKRDELRYKYEAYKNQNRLSRR